ncbi:MAG: type IV toxin-antitoxin system AbiEi family antitoxin [Thermoplasmatota archaeon]
MNKTEQIHKNILQENVVNKKDLKIIAKKVLGKKDSSYLQRKYLYRLQKDHKIKKIKKGLYYGIPLEKESEKFEVDRYILANKIRQGYALGYHSALELFGAAYSATNTIYILIQKKKRFNPFQFQNVVYQPVINKLSTTHLKKISYKNKQIIITDPARTFIECLNRLDLCGGWEECLKSLANLKSVTIPDLKDVLTLYDNKTLTLKTGYVLELLSKVSPYYDHIKTKGLQTFKSSESWIPVYIDRDVPSKLNKKWGLFIPKGTDDLLRGI